MYAKTEGEHNGFALRCSIVGRLRPFRFRAVESGSPKKEGEGERTSDGPSEGIVEDLIALPPEREGEGGDD